jgi:hypothetical protein
LIEATIILAAVGQRYRFTIDPEAVIEIKPQITLMPASGIPVTLQRRAANCGEAEEASGRSALAIERENSRSLSQSEFPS